MIDNELENKNNQIKYMEIVFYMMKINNKFYMIKINNKLKY